VENMPMKISLEAVYERGVLRPLSPLDLKESERVTLTIARPDDAQARATMTHSCRQETGEPPSLHAVRAALATIPGSLTDDWAAERQER
jgi:predicted DNA-binding antitoxin AbrB/MazE fold protein